MKELSPKAAAMFRAGRNAFRPNEADRDRVFRSLSAAIGQDSAGNGTQRGGDFPPAQNGPAARGAFNIWGMGGAAVVLIGAGAVLMPHLAAHTSSRVGSDRPTASAPAIETAAPIDPPSTEVAAGPERTPAELASTALSPSSGSRRAHSDSLAEEVRLLSRAQQQMNEGHAENALKTLAEHERRFSSGTLAEERTAARVHALCALGRTAEAKSEIAKLTRAHPRSAQIDRARKMCGTGASVP